VITFFFPSVPFLDRELFDFEFSKCAFRVYEVFIDDIFQFFVLIFVAAVYGFCYLDGCCDGLGASHANRLRRFAKKARRS